MVTRSIITHVGEIEAGLAEIEVGLADLYQARIKRNPVWRVSGLQCQNRFGRFSDPIDSINIEPGYTKGRFCGKLRPVWWKIEADL